MTIVERKMTMKRRRLLEGSLPETATLEGGPWLIENPGEYGPGEVGLRFDTDAGTVRVEPAAAA